MEAIIRVALMLFFIQFVVMITVMLVAMLMAQPEVPGLGRGRLGRALRRCWALAVYLPGWAGRSLVRAVHAAQGWRGTR